jgi:[ribosomal protein S5]-alanine N-acetyltransferase
MNIKVEILQKTDAEQLFQFETENRAFFETLVPSRGDNYYQYNQFLQIMDELLIEQTDRKSFFYLIKEEKTSKIVGRINLVDIDWDNMAVEIGYRMGEPYLKMGLATKALSKILIETEKMNIRTIYAKTTYNNLGSQKVLENNGFLRQIKNEDLEFIRYVFSENNM